MFVIYTDQFMLKLKYLPFVCVRSRIYISPLANLMISTPSRSYTIHIAEPVHNTNRFPLGLCAIYVTACPLSGSRLRNAR